MNAEKKKGMEIGFMKWIQKHRTLVATLIIGIGAIALLATLARRQTLSNTTESRLANPPRSGEAVQTSFYYDQLVEKERVVFDQIVQCIEERKGGVITLAEPLTGRQYTRVCNALEFDEHNYFYGVVEVPMTADNRYLKYDPKANLMEIDEPEIEKCILFLYSAEGINEKTTYTEDGHVRQMDRFEEILSQNNEERLAKINEISEKTNVILDEIIAGIPENYGQKETVDYFLEWMDKNLIFSEMDEEVTTMQGMFEEHYFSAHVSCVVDRDGLTSGYAKLLATLCNRAGMEAHVVFGIWHEREGGYAMTSVKIGEDTVYVDAAGRQAPSLGNQRYLREDELANHMAFAEYFSYK